MLRRSSIVRTALMATVAAMVATACGSSPTGSGGDVGQGSLTGAGATFVAPFFQKAFFDYSSKYPQVTINYQSVGSGAGIQQFIKKTVDFGASDVPMAGADITAAGGEDKLTQIPVTLGAEAITFNIKGVDQLNLDADTLAGIYLGQIKKWNDPKIAALNSGANLPNKAITVVHRSDGSGTTYIFTDYMSKISAEWKSKVGTAKSVQWPTGVGGAGNEAVAQAVLSTDGSIGYVELAYAVQASMKVAALKNANGKFLKASQAGATAAAGTNNNISPTNFSIVNSACDDCYPITGFSWVMLYTNYSDGAKGKAVVNLFKWLVTDGQVAGKDLQYAPLPAAVEQLALNNLKTIKAGGSPVLS